METATRDKVYDDLVLYGKFKRASIYYMPNQPVAVVEATDTYIPIEEFKELFHKAGQLVKERHIKKLVFDKRNLRVFHQPSMEWYFTDWKIQMLDLGLTQHRKLLPEDKVFRQSVRIGREKIMQENSNSRIKELEIRYADTLAEAIAE